MIQKGTLALLSKKKLFSRLTGEHNTVLSGSGMEFKELREYMSGDDVRHINPKVTAKMGVPHVNVFHEDKKLNIVIAFLNSGSIYFGGQKSKKETMVEVLMNICGASLSRQDMLSVTVYSDESEFFLKPTRDKKAVLNMLENVVGMQSLGKSVDYKGFHEYLFAKIKKKSLIVLVGDFLEFEDFRLLGAKHEVYAAVVRDRLEEDIKFFGELNLQDTNSGKSGLFHLDRSSVQEYKKMMQRHDDALFKNFIQSDIAYEKIYTDDDVVKKLRKLLQN